jgi:hypothetical protein
MRGSVLFLALVASAVFFPGRAASGNLEPVEECMRRNLPERASARGISMLSVDRTGGEREFTGKLYWKRWSADHSGLLLRLDSPPDVRRSSYLVLQDGPEEQMFVYLPNMQRVRRIHPDTASGSLFGTDFSYADLKYLQMMENITISERLEDGVVGERPAYHVRTKAKPEEKSPYDHVDAMIDRETCLPLQIEFFGSDGSVQKRLTTAVDSFTREGAIWVARSATLRDLRNETSTSLDVDGIEVDGDVSDRLFTVTYLERGR